MDMTCFMTPSILSEYESIFIQWGTATDYFLVNALVIRTPNKFNFEAGRRVDRLLHEWGGASTPAPPSSDAAELLGL